MSDNRCPTCGQPLPTFLDEVELSTRVANALRRAGYDTREALLSLTYKDLLAIPGLSRKSAIEVQMTQEAIRDGFYD